MTMGNMLEGKVVLISGASGRLGKSFCKEVLQQGGSVVALDVVQDEEFFRQLSGEKLLFVKGSIVRMDEVEGAISSGMSKFGKLDAAIHSAYPRSKGWGTRFEDLKPEFLFQDLSDQLGGAILFSQRVMKCFEKQGWGNLIHISSIQGIAAPKFEHYEGTTMVSPIEYSCIKSGIIALTRYLAKYYKNKNIRVNCLSLGGIIDGQPQSFLERYRKSCSNKGMLEAQDLNGAILYLLSDGSKYCTGQNLIVDDGWSL